jgi:hypothetical protein
LRFLRHVFGNLNGAMLGPDANHSGQRHGGILCP